MTNQDVLTQIEKIFQKVLKKENVHLSESMSSNDVDGWNSLAHMMIIADVEKHYGIQFNFREIVKLRNVGDLCGAVQKKMQ